MLTLTPITMRVIDRTGVDAANRSDMEEIGTERIGYDERERWHGPGGIQRASVAAETVPLRVRMVNAAWLALAISIVGGAWAGLIWAVIRMVQKAGLPW